MIEARTSNVEATPHKAGIELRFHTIEDDLTVQGVFAAAADTEPEVASEPTTHRDSPLSWAPRNTDGSPESCGEKSVFEILLVCQVGPE